MSDLNAWFSDRPKWLQKAANILLREGTFSEEDIASLVKLCIEEATGDIECCRISSPLDTLTESNVFTLHLESISDVNAINALAPRNPLVFGPSNLSVIYGSNGSGKSGYVRILKHGCGAREQGRLHANVYCASSSPQECKISFNKNNVTKEITWNPSDGIIPDLRHVDILDADCGRMYLDSECEVAYEPPILLFLSTLVELCKKIFDKLNELQSKLISRKPSIPNEFITTEYGQWYSNLSEQTLSGDIISNCLWTEADIALYTQIQSRLSEPSPAEKAKSLLMKNQHLNSLISGIENILNALSDENCQQIIKLAKDKKEKEEAASIAASKVFDNAPLDGIGSETWKLLWTHARKYSEEIAYKDVEFPNINPDALCVLCNQPLSENARNRLKTFEDFVRGESEKAVSEANRVLISATESIGIIPSQDILKTRYDASGLLDDDDKDFIIELYKILEERRDQLFLAETIDDLSAIPNCSNWLEKVKSISSEYEKLAKSYRQDAEENTHPLLQAQLLNLRAKKWLSEQSESINAEVERIKKTNEFEAAKKLTITRELSKEKGTLAEKLITPAFVQRFNDELRTLGASHIKVELVKKRVEYGHVLHEVRLTNANAGTLGEVLSEGENRIISLAAFLADVTGKDHSTPLVFDDPISSLDQNFEETVAQRLVKLAQQRQIIVFTHRISLLVMLQDYGKKDEIEPKIIYLRSEVWGVGEPGETPLFAKKPNKALNALLNDRLPEALKALSAEGQEMYTPLAIAICTEFRILLERMIECELLADVIQRFRRAINTQGKIDRLALISTEDCKFFDAMMTKYSRYEHSQPYESPVGPPLPEDLKNDLEGLKKWYEEFTRRNT